MGAPAAPSQEERDYHLRVPWSAKELPLLKGVSKEHRDFYSALLVNVNCWSQLGPVAFTYSQLFNDPADCTPHLQALRALLGKKTWSGVYGDRNVQAADIVPNAMGFPLLCALNRLASEDRTAEVAQQELDKLACDATMELLKEKQDQRMPGDPF